MTDEHQRSQRFGWTSLLLWAGLGLVLESAHGLKLSSYLDDEMVRLLLRLAHSHGVGLALVVLVYGSSGVPLLASRSDGGRPIGTLLRLGALILPLGFLLSVLGHTDTDPGLGILLSPLGAMLLLAGLGRMAWVALKKS